MSIIDFSKDLLKEKTLFWLFQYVSYYVKPKANNCNNTILFDYMCHAISYSDTNRVRTLSQEFKQVNINSTTRLFLTNCSSFIFSQSIINSKFIKKYCSFEFPQ